jgi:hypothetical protein
MNLQHLAINLTFTIAQHATLSLRCVRILEDLMTQSGRVVAQSGGVRGEESEMRKAIGPESKSFGKSNRRRQKKLTLKWWSCECQKVSHRTLLKKFLLTSDRRTLKKFHLQDFRSRGTFWQVYPHKMWSPSPSASDFFSQNSITF